jgi:hypothetical protein
MKPITLIVGPGRSGTTFLWRLLKELGYDTGDKPEYFSHSKGEAAKGNIPYVVKGVGGLAHNLPGFVKRYDLDVDHVIVALRGLEANIRSRREYSKNPKSKRHEQYYKNMSEEEHRDHFSNTLPKMVGRLMFSLIEGDHPYTIVVFPKSAQDVDYCYEKITAAMGDIPYDKFVEAWNKVVKPELIRSEV